MVWRTSRRGAATGGFAIMVAVMFVGTAVGAAAFYYSLGHATSAVGIASLPDSGKETALPGSPPANFTAFAAQVAVADAELPASDFSVNGTASTFTCASSPSGAYLVLTDRDAGSDSVASVSISYVGGTTVFTPSATCDIGAETTYILFPATSELDSTAVSGQSYEGFVAMADGTPATFQGAWQ